MRWSFKVLINPTHYRILRKTQMCRKKARFLGKKKHTAGSPPVLLWELFGGPHSPPQHRPHPLGVRGSRRDKKPTRRAGGSTTHTQLWSQVPVLLRHPETPPVLQGNVGLVRVPGPEFLEEASLEVGQHPVHVHQHPQSPAGPRRGAQPSAQPRQGAAAPGPQVQKAAQQNHCGGELGAGDGGFGLRGGNGRLREAGSGQGMGAQGKGLGAVEQGDVGLRVGGSGKRMGAWDRGWGLEEGDRSLKKGLGSLRKGMGLRAGDGASRKQMGQGIGGSEQGPGQLSRQRGRASPSLYFKHAPSRRAALPSASPCSRRKGRRGAARGSRGAAGGRGGDAKARPGPQRVLPLPAPSLPGSERGAAAATRAAGAAGPVPGAELAPTRQCKAQFLFPVPAEPGTPAPP